MLFLNPILSMSANIFDKVLKIIQIVVTILQFAIRSFTGLDPVEEGEE